MAFVPPSAVNPPYGYGHDLSCVSDLDPAMIETDGRKLLGEAIARRLQTNRGGLIDDPNYGTNITDLIDDELESVTTSNASKIAALVDAEAQKDERVVSSSTTATWAAPGVLTIVVSLTDRNGTFALVLAATSVAVKVIS